MEKSCKLCGLPGKLCKNGRQFNLCDKHFSKSISDNSKNIVSWRKGKSFEEMYGKEKAKNIKNKISVYNKGRPKPEGTGKKISESLLKSGLAIHSPEVYKKMIQKRRDEGTLKHTDATKKLISERCKNRMNDPEVKRKQREGLLKHLEIFGKFKIGSNETEILNQLSYELKIHIIPQYKVLGYILDGYSKKLNIAFEVDEEHHRYRSKNNDIIRQRNIEKELKCKFIRVLDYKNYSGVEDE